MTDEEKALRLTALTEMFLGYGIEASEERLRWYANETHLVPLELHRQAISNACAEVKGSWPPGVGAIQIAARWLSAGEDHRGEEPPRPRWYRLHLRRHIDEKPKELGARTGPGADFKAIAAGVEK